MKTIINCLCFLFLCSCSSDLIDSVPDNIDKETLQSKTIYNFSFNHPKFMVTGNYYTFTLDGFGAEDFRSILWHLNGKTLGTGTRVDAIFDRGGWYSFYLDFYDFSYDHWSGYTNSFPVYQKAPSIVSKNRIIDTEGNYTFTVDYPHIGKYNIEWEFPDGVQRISSSNTQAILKFPSAGTYSIKCRAKEECPYVSDGTYVSDWGTLSVSVIPKLIPDQWVVRNFIQSGDEVFYDVMYKNTNYDTYICESLYTTFLYDGAYDGYYGGFSFDWVYNSTYNLYFPYSVDPDYGFETREWDFYDAGQRVLIGSSEIYSCLRKARIASGKTWADIEYILFFIYDNKRNDRYVDETGSIE